MKNRLKFTKPAEAFTEASPIGCGRLGAMVYGIPGRERIALNEDSLWSGCGKDKNNPSAEYLVAARKAVYDGDIKEAEEIVNRKMLGDMSETYLPFGDMYITLPEGETSGYLRTLDIENGVAYIEYDTGDMHIKETCFASYRSQIISVRFDFSKPASLEASLTSQLRYKVSAEDGLLCMDGIAPETDLPTARGIVREPEYGGDDSKAIRFSGLLKTETDGKTEISDGVKITDATFAVFSLSLATSFVSATDTAGDAPGRAKGYLDAAPGYDAMLDEHKKDFSSLYDSVSLSICGGREYTVGEMISLAVSGEDTAPLCEALFDFGRYLMISSSREGSQPTNLQGVWNVDLHPAWCSNYTININLEMNYWAAEVAGLSECTAPLFDFLKRLAESGEHTAKVHYGCRGWTAHSGSDIWAYTTSCGPVNERRGCSRYAFWMMAPGWLCRHLYEHYIYLGGEKGKDFLEKTALPIMAGACRFYLDFLSENGRGELVMCPSVSPENAYLKDGEPVCFCAGSQMDAMILRELFSNTLTAVRVCGGYEDIVRGIEAALPKIPKIKLISDGRIMEWDGDYKETEPHHRHMSHMYALYPSAQIDGLPPEYAEGCRRVLEKRGYEATGWSAVWKACCYARLRDGESALICLRELMHEGSAARSSVYPNLFLSCPPFQIDANFGIIAAVCEMLLRDRGDSYEMLPALPASWKDGEIKGLRLKNGNTLDFSWRDGKVVSCSER